MIATEDKVVLGVRSTQLQEIGGVPLGGQIFQVLTLRHHDGRIIRVDEYRRRSEALEPRIVPTGYRSSRGGVTLRNSTIYVALHRGDCLGPARTRS